MPEGSHSALHQDPMGEGKINTIKIGMTHVLVIAAYELTSLIRDFKTSVYFYLLNLVTQDGVLT